MSTPHPTSIRLPIIAFSTVLTILALANIADAWVKHTLIEKYGSFYVTHTIADLSNASDLFFPNQSSFLLYDIFHSTRVSSVVGFVLVMVFIYFVPSLIRRFGYIRFGILYVSLSVLSIAAMVVF